MQPEATSYGVLNKGSAGFLHCFPASWGRKLELKLQLVCRRSPQWGPSGVNWLAGEGGGGAWSFRAAWASLAVTGYLKPQWGPVSPASFPRHQALPSVYVQYVCSSPPASPRQLLLGSGAVQTTALVLARELPTGSLCLRRFFGKHNTFWFRASHCILTGVAATSLLYCLWNGENILFCKATTYRLLGRWVLF